MISRGAFLPTVAVSFVKELEDFNQIKCNVKVLLPAG